MALPTRQALFRLRWLLLAPVPIAWCVAAHLGALAFLENKTVDWRFRFRGPIDAPIKVVYVDVDSRSIGEIGNLPWSREYFATTAKALIENGGAKAVGIDFVFSDEGVPESIDLQKLIAGNKALGYYLWRKNPPVVIGASYSAGDFRAWNLKDHPLKVREFPVVSNPYLPPVKEIEPPEYPSFNVGRSTPFEPPGAALIDTIDGGTRWVRLYAPTFKGTYYAMAVELARLYLGVDRAAITVEGDRMQLRRPDGTLAASIPLVDRQAVEINWFSPWIDASRNLRVSLSVVYEYAQILAAGSADDQRIAREFFAQFKDAVVLIGPTDKLIQDVAPTPMDEASVPRVGVHGNLLKTIVSGLYLRHLTEWGAYAIIFALSAAVALLAIAGGGRAVFAKVMAVLSAGIYVGVAFQLFKSAHVVIPIVAPLGSAFSTSFLGLVWQIVEEQKQKGRIKGLFGTYVSPALVHRMVESGEEPKLGGVTENITAYFSDIQSFSSFSEKLSPPQLVELMNEYLTACTDIVQDQGGTLDKYIGDAVVTIFGAPLVLADHPYRACLAALRVQKGVALLREKWRSEGEKWPEIVHELQTRIGLNSGPAVVGNMGSHTRFNYTMMGDNVNIAARMESGAKSWGVYTMCTDATRLGCEAIAPGAVVFRALGKIKVKGREQPLPFHEAAALREDATTVLRECIGIFEQGLDRLYARAWDDAIALFKASEPLEAYGPGRIAGTTSNPSLVYLRIAAGLRASPPAEDWDGVYEMTEK